MSYYQNHARRDQFAKDTTDIIKRTLLKHVEQPGVLYDDRRMYNFKWDGLKI